MLLSETAGGPADNSLRQIITQEDATVNGTLQADNTESLGTIDTLPPTLYNRTVKVGFGTVHGKEKEYL